MSNGVWLWLSVCERREEYFERFSLSFPTSSIQLKRIRENKFGEWIWNGRWSYTERKYINKMLFATETMTCSNRDNGVFLCCSFEMNLQLVGLVFYLYSKKLWLWRLFFCRFVRLSQSNFFLLVFVIIVVVGRFLLLSSSVSIFLDFYVFIFAWKSSLTTYGLLWFFLLTLNETCKCALYDVYVVLCMDVWDDWKRLTWE